MTDPYLLLGLGRDADDAAVHAAYLERLKQHPPERDPEGFKRLREAYDQLKSARLRAAFELFQVCEPDRDALLGRLLGGREPPRRPDLATMRRLLGTPGARHG